MYLSIQKKLESLNSVAVKKYIRKAANTTGGFLDGTYVSLSLFGLRLSPPNILYGFMHPHQWFPISFAQLRCFLKSVDFFGCGSPQRMLRMVVSDFAVLVVDEHKTIRVST
jgi:hypothetical protein